MSIARGGPRRTAQAKAAAAAERPGEPPASRLQAHGAKLLDKHPPTFAGNEYGARSLQTPGPALRHAVGADGRPNETAQVQAPLTPIEARAAKHPSGTFAATDPHCRPIDAD